MSQCENCGERPAVIHLTQVVGGSQTTMHLCEQCAAEKGVETGAALTKFPLGDFLASLAKADQSSALDIPCPHCGATLHNFRETGRLGCAHCYEAFEGHLRDLLRRLHGSAVHTGERYRTHGASGAPGAPAATPAPVTTPRDDAAGELEALRARLARAVEAENFELAAELRDKIRVLE